MCERYHIKHSFATIFNPRGNALAERINLTIGNALRCNIGKNLLTLTREIETALRISYSRALKCSPHEMLFKNSPYDLNQPQKKINIPPDDTIETKPIASKLNVGDQVPVKNFIRKKFDAFYEGPYIVVERLKTAYLIDKGYCEKFVNQNIWFFGEGRVW
jgi:hypothetical protein